MRALRASGASMWMNCAAYLYLKQEPDGHSGDEGTLLHNRLDGNEPNITGLTDEQARMVEGAHEYVNSLNLHYVRRESDIEIKEVRGTVDVSGIDQEGSLHIVDYKFGYGPVPSRNNWQLIIYALGAHLKYSLPMVGRVITESLPPSVTVHIYQPRDFINGPSHCHVITRDELKVRLLELSTRVQELSAGTREARTGGHCRYCPSRFYCPAFLENISHVSNSVITNPDDVELTNESLAEVYKYILETYKIVKTARDSFESKIIHVIKNQGNVIPGVILDRTSRKRRWKADMGELEAAGKMIDVPLVKTAPVPISSIPTRKLVSKMISPLLEKSSGTEKLTILDLEQVADLFERSNNGDD